MELYNKLFLKRQFRLGNYLNWSTSEWTLENMDSRIFTQEEICGKPKSFDLPTLVKGNFTASQQLCRKYGGKMTVVTSVEMYKKLFTDQNLPKTSKIYLTDGLLQNIQLLLWTKNSDFFNKADKYVLTCLGIYLVPTACTNKKAP
jgi:hypothetical protein